MSAPEERPRQGGLWRDRDFMRLWSGESLSMFGAQISLVAIPLLAVATLDATPFEMGVVNAAQFLPYLLFTLPAGVWVDQRRRRPLMIGANLGRAAVYGLVPLGTALGLLGIWGLAAIVFLAATLTVVFDLAYQSYLPSLVGREHLVEANGKLEGSRSVAQASGPGIAGLLVGLITAPVTVLVNALTYLVAGFAAMRIRKPEEVPAATGEQGSMLSRIGTGLRLIGHNPYLRAIAGEASVYNLFNQALWTALVLYLTHRLHFSALTIGIVLAMSGVGAFLGSLAAGWCGRHWGLGRTIMIAMLIGCASPLIIPAASGDKHVAIPIVAFALLLNGAGVVICNIQVISLRQTAVPSDVLGRANAGYRFLVTGAAALGSLLGGGLGELIGLRATLVVGGLGTLAALSFFLGSPIPKLKDLSEVAPPEPGTGGVPSRVSTGDDATA
ncbi:MFS transporter [Streptomyces sp. NPDC056528]|uniref:MFS transporter n=1 Tax=Streptomyces sp. NPDC056528 TaxID=3345854 RepID=UPI0036B3781F